jgi:hypothetical protein
MIREEGKRGSLRFNNPVLMKQAKELQKILCERSIDACIIEAVSGYLVKMIVSKLVESRMVVIFGTEDYGMPGSVNFSTQEELQFIKDKKKPLYLIKMCDQFSSDVTSFHLPQPTPYFFLGVGSPIPLGTWK